MCLYYYFSRPTGDGEKKIIILNTISIYGNYLLTVKHELK